MSITGFTPQQAHKRLNQMLSNKKATTLYFHGVDNDGEYGEAVIHSYISTHHADLEVRSVAINYGQEIKEEDVVDRNVIFVDYCPNTKEGIETIITKANDYMVIDHHRTSLAKFQVFATTHDIFYFKKFRDHLFFDFKFSGAYLAEKITKPSEQVSGIINYIDDRDLWKKQLPKENEVHLLLNAKRIAGEAGNIYDKYAHLDTEDFLSDLQDIEAVDMEELGLISEHQINSLATKYQKVRMLGYRVALVTNSDHSLTSDLSSQILSDNNEIDFVAVITKIDFLNNCYHLGLRSREGGVDVSEFAVELDYRGQGGGHQPASGCHVNMVRFQNLFEEA